jgi:Ca2+/Na+ antiporter
MKWSLLTHAILLTLTIFFFLLLTTGRTFFTSMFPLLTNTHLFTLIVLLLAFLLVSFVAYRKKIEIEEIEEKLKKYREKTKTTLEMKEIGPREEGNYYREENKIEIVSTFPHPLEGYETPAMQRVKTHYKEKWEELKEILLSATKNPYLSSTEKEKLLSRLDELEIEIMKGKNLPEEEKLKLISLHKLDYLLDNLENCLYPPPLTQDDIKKAVEWLQKIAKISVEYQKYLPSELKDLSANVEKLINEFLLLSLRSDSPRP